MSKGLEELNEIKDFTLVCYDEDGNEEDCTRLFQEMPESFEVIEKELKAYSSLKEIIKDKIKELNNQMDEMNKKIDENEYAFADEDFKAEYDYCETQLSVFNFVLNTMEELEQ